VIQADGGTRTAAVTGAYVALALAMRRIVADGLIAASPLAGSVAAVSCGLIAGEPVLDLDYQEDSTAQADANFVLTGAGAIVEVQGTAEREPFSRASFDALLALAEKGVRELTALQALALNNQ
jgi:ribonuclease PH